MTARELAISVAALLGFTATPSPAAAEPALTVTLHYYERRPFHFHEGDKVTGLVVPQTEAAFQKAGISYTWSQEPPNRILAIIKANAGADCSPGWYKTPEREAFARYTLPIYADKPLVGISRADFAAPEGISAKVLLAEPRIRLLVKDQFSYGKYLNTLIGDMPPNRVVRINDDIVSMVRLVKYGSAHVTLATQEEVELLVQQAGFLMGDFRIIRFPDVPAEEKRFIICSQQVPPAAIERLNEAIRSASPPPSRPD